MTNNKLVLGSQSSNAASHPAKVSTRVFKYEAPAIVSSTETGGLFLLKADTGPVYPGGRDTVGVAGTGCKLSDFLPSSTYTQYDYYRVVKIEYTATLANVPRQSTPNVHVYCSVDWDNASNANFPTFMKRPNVSLTVLTATAPTQKLIDYKPRRRISSNVDPTQQVVTKPDEWVDIAYAGSQIFGNVLFGILCPDGQVQYSSPADPGAVLVSSRMWVEFKGRIN